VLKVLPSAAAKGGWEVSARSVARGLLAIACCSITLYQQISHAGSRSESKNYLGSSTFGLPDPCIFHGLVESRGIGGNCFAIQPGESSVSFVVADATTLRVGGASYFFTASGASINPGGDFFCGGNSLTIPSGAAVLGVQPDTAIGTTTCLFSVLGKNPLNNPLFPLTQYLFGEGTTGTITATFTSP